MQEHAHAQKFQLAIMTTRSFTVNVINVLFHLYVLFFCVFFFFFLPLGPLQIDVMIYQKKINRPEALKSISYLDLLPI